MADEQQVTEPTIETPAPPVEPVQTEPAQVETVNIPVSQLEQYGGKDWHQALGYAKTGKAITESGWHDKISEWQGAGITADSLDAFIQEALSSEAPEQPEQTAYPLTEDSIKTVVSQEIMGALAHRDFAVKQESAWNAEKQFKESAIADVVGESSEIGDFASSMFDKILNDVAIEKLGPLASQAQKDAVSRTPANSEVLAVAKERFQNRMTDIENVMVSKRAEAQKNIPPALDGGPSGNAPAKRIDEMGKQDRVAAIAAELGIEAG